MNSIKIKICGITNIEDAKDAIEAGACALGFVFYEKSPRYIDATKAYEIIKQLPPFVQCVGLFVNSTAQQINKIAQISKINIAQIHFEATQELYDSLTIPHFKVLRAKSKKDIENNQGKYILVDAFVEQYGGMGKKIDISWFDNIDCSKFILAGGLNSQNIDTIKEYKFYGVDISSAVEIKKGKKDKKLMEEFCRKTYEIFR